MKAQGGYITPTGSSWIAATYVGCYETEPLQTIACVSNIVNLDLCPLCLWLHQCQHSLKLYWKASELSPLNPDMLNRSIQYSQATDLLEGLYSSFQIYTVH